MYSQNFNPFKVTVDLFTGTVYSYFNHIKENIIHPVDFYMYFFSA